MNRKHNPMLSLAALVLLAVILALACTGCTPTEKAETPEPMEPQETTETLPRFTVETQNTVYGSIQIITDNETGVQYLFYKFGYGGGLTQLLPGEG